MRKSVLFVILVLLSVFLFIGCKTENTYNVMTHISFDEYELALADASDGADTGDIIIPWYDIEKEYPTRFYDEKAPKEMTVTVFGEKHTGVYQFTERKPTNSSIYSRSYYEDQTSFEFNVDTSNNVVYFSKIGTLDSDNEKTERECLDIANDFVRDIISLDEYEPKIQYFSDAEKYYIEYQKTVCGYPTHDYVTVVVSTSGEIYLFGTCNPGLIDKNATIDIDREKIETELINIALNGEKTKEASIKEAHLTILPDGRPAIEYDVVVKWYAPDGDPFDDILSFYVIGKGE